VAVFLSVSGVQGKQQSTDLEAEINCTKKTYFSKETKTPLSLFCLPLQIPPGGTTTLTRISFYGTINKSNSKK
jgi:hypothetical protein